MPSKRTLIIVFTGIIFIWSFSFIIHFFETRKKFRIENLSYKEIKFIEIDDRGIIGGKKKQIYNKDTLQKIAVLLKNSKEVKLGDINIKSSNGLCELNIYFNNYTTNTIDLYNTSFSGGIVASGDYYYRNDMLLGFIFIVLKTNR